MCINLIKDIRRAALTGVFTTANAGKTSTAGYQRNRSLLVLSLRKLGEIVAGEKYDGAAPASAVIPDVLPSPPDASVATTAMTAYSDRYKR